MLGKVVSDARIESSRDSVDRVSETVYATRWVKTPIPRFSIPQNEMPANVAYRMITDELGR